MTVSLKDSLKTFFITASTAAMLVGSQMVTVCGAAENQARASAQKTQEIEDNKVYATLTSDKFTVKVKGSDIKNFIQSIPPQVLQSLTSDQNGFANVLKSAAQVAFVKENAIRAGVEKTENYKKEYEKSVNLIKTGLLIQTYLNDTVTKKIEALKSKKQYDKQMKSTYEELKKAAEKGPKIEQYDISAAFFPTDATAQDFLKKVKTSKDFGKTLEEAQKAAPDLQGGNMGFVNLDMLPQEIRSVIQSKKPKGGTLLDKPIKIDVKGVQNPLYVAVRVNSTRIAPTPTFEEAQSVVENVIRQKLLAEVVAETPKAIKKVEAFDLNGQPLTLDMSAESLPLTPDAALAQ